MIKFLRALRALKRTVLALFVIVLVAFAIGAIYQYAATRLDDGKYLPPGRMVAVNGRTMHLNCSGEENGGPTVILEAGLGGASLDWELVQPDVSKFARVCSYDRAGMAWSMRSKDVRDADHISDELHQLLSTADVSPPYVLVGHSIGGVYTQLFAAKHPNEVAGVVLVDSSHPDQLTRYPTIPAFVPYLYKAAAPVGVARLVNKLTPSQPNAGPELSAKLVALYSRTDSVDENADEMAAIPMSMEELRATRIDLGNKPLVVLAHGLDEGSSPKLLAIWQDVQSSLAKLSTTGKLVIAEHSGHYIQFYEPELVVDAIREVMQNIATHQP